MKITAKFKLTSIENASLIRKFTVLFIVMSLLPFLIIAYLFTQYIGSGIIVMDQHKLLILLFLAGFGALAGFWGIRKSIIRLQKLTKKTKEAFGKNIPDFVKLEVEENEVTQLAVALEKITKYLEDNVRHLEVKKASQ